MHRTICTSLIAILLPLSALEVYDGPVLAEDLSLSACNETLKRMNITVVPTINGTIPKIVWISFRYVPPETRFPDHLKKFIRKASEDGWQINLMGKDDQQQFMQSCYPNTSLLWAFNLIHPDAGVFASDIWRYAVLYRFGGFYIDDDSYIDAALSSVSTYFIA
jgi:mannosyltransferase OCH1-like enzyme